MNTNFSLKLWIEQDLCSPKKLPISILKNRDELNGMRRAIVLLAEQVLAKQAIDQEIIDFVNSLSLSTDDGVREWSFSRHDFEIELNKILEPLDESQRQFIADLRKDEQRLGRLFVELEKRNKELFFGCMHYFNSPTGCWAHLAACNNLQEIFGTIPYLLNDLERRHCILPFGDPNVDFNRAIKGVSVRCLSHLCSGAQLKVLAAFGKERGAILVRNLHTCFGLAEELEAEMKIDESIIKAFGDFYFEVKERLPELLDYAKQLGTRFSLQDIDFENKTAVFLGHRSHHGGSGGIARWAIISVWSNGSAISQSYQHRDQYRFEDDNPENDFNRLEICSIDDGADTTEVHIKAYYGYHSCAKSRVEKFSLKKVLNNDLISYLSDDDFVLFKQMVNQEMGKILSEKQDRIKNCTRVAPDYSGRIPWNSPFVKEVVYEKSGIAVFSIVEAIDYGRPGDITMEQQRCELYLMLHNDDGKAIEISRDHAYLMQTDHPRFDSIRDNDSYGDPVMSNILIVGNKITYLSRGQQKEFLMEEVTTE